jgi:hypothetical protein
MFDKKKINFWRLAFIFTALIVMILVFEWNSPQEKKAQMMDKSMGSMMNQMHVTNATIYDLFSKNDNQGSMNEMSSHHPGQSEMIFKLNFISTAIIFFLLPLIIGGAIILGIVWIR